MAGPGALTGALFTVAVFVLHACSSGSGENGSPPIGDGGASPAAAPASAVASSAPDPVVVAPAASRPALPPARDADQEFLRHMLDHHETVLAAVHGQMMEPGKHAEHGTKADPTEWDARLDIEKRDMLALLKQYYGEDYSPWATPPVPAPLGSDSSHDMAGMSMPAGAAATMQGKPMEEESPLARQLRDGAALAERFAPKLTRPAVRSLALRVRASQLELARKVSGLPGTP